MAAGQTINPSKLSNEEREKRMSEKIQTGEAIESVDDMSDEYYESLATLMLQQADSELACAFGYVPWIMKAPTTEERLAVANIVRDEVRHARAMYRLLTDIGVDSEARVANHDYGFQADLNLNDLKIEQTTDDRREEIFYYTIHTWPDFVMFQFCMDRGEGHRLEDLRKSTYGPWRREVERILKEEITHLNHGDFWVKKLAFDRSTKAEIQAALDKWYPRTMNIFGMPGSPDNILYRKCGLKARDNGDVRKSFSDDLRLRCSELGLRLPYWKPDREKVEEDGVIPG